MNAQPIASEISLIMSAKSSASLVVLAGWREVKRWWRRTRIIPE
jgi:hypothetical protein